jgi:hypothetical protein
MQLGCKDGDGASFATGLRKEFPTFAPENNRDNDAVY